MPKPAAHAFADTHAEFKTSAGKTGQFFSLPKLAEAFPNVSRMPISMRIVLESVLRNCDGKKVTTEHVHAARQLEADRRARGRDSVRRRPRRAAGLHRRAAAGRPGGDAQRGGLAGQEPQDDRAAGAGGPGGRPQRDDRLLRHQQGAGPEHEARVRAQPRALRVHEVGHAGLRHLRRRAARLRHRAPGQPGVPRARRAQGQGRRRITPTAWSAPTATRP